MLGLLLSNRSKCFLPHFRKFLSRHARPTRSAPFMLAHFSPLQKPAWQAWNCEPQRKTLLLNVRLFVYKKKTPHVFPCWKWAQMVLWHPPGFPIQNCIFCMWPSEQPAGLSPGPNPGSCSSSDWLDALRAQKRGAWIPKTQIR